MYTSWLRQALALSKRPRRLTPAPPTSSTSGMLPPSMATPSATHALYQLRWCMAPALPCVLFQLMLSDGRACKHGACITINDSWPWSFEVCLLCGFLEAVHLAIVCVSSTQGYCVLVTLCLLHAQVPA